MAIGLVLLLAGRGAAQTGVRVVLYDYELDGEGSYSLRGFVGLGADHDFSERTSMGVDLRYGISYRTVGGQVRSAFHFSDAGSASFYLGPTVGIQVASEHERYTFVPVGMRMGVRGGLERFYADLYLGFVSNLGAANAVQGRSERGDVAPVGVTVGLNIGFGWVSRERN